MKDSVNRLSCWVAFLAATTGIGLASSSDSLEIFVVNPLEKVFEDMVPDSGGANEILKLEAAANEYESAQFAIRSRLALRGISIGLGSLRNAATGAFIPATELKARFVAFVPVTRNTTEARCGKHRDIPPSELLRQAPFDCPDPLLESPTIDLGANKAQPVWITAHVPKGTAPGIYSGEIQVRTPSGEQGLPIELLVYPFELSDERHFYLTNWFEISHIARAHKVELLSEEYWQILARYAEDLAEHHQNVIYTPWRLVHVYRESDGSLSFDYGDFDRFVQTFIDAGTAERIEIQHVAHHGERGRAGREILLSKVRPVDRQTGERVALDGNEGMAALLKDLHRHLREKGWLDRAIIHVADEPSFHNVNEWKAISKFVHEHFPGVKTIDAIGATGYEDSLDIMVPLTRDLHTWFDDFKTAQSAGTELWFYTCCSPWGKYANRFLDYHLSKTRILHWMNYFTGTEGFLHWGLTYGWDDPFGPAPRYPPGDSHIIYPGEEGPMSSVRWEMLREGLEDYEYLWLLEAKTKKLLVQLGVGPEKFPVDALSQEICGRLVRSLTDYVTDPETFYQVRRELAAEIVAIEKSPLIALTADPHPRTPLDTGPAVTKLYGFVEKETSLKINGSEVWVNPEDGSFVRKVSLSWSRPVVTVEAELGGQRKVFKKHFEVR
jgi:hypothetical protein